VSTDRSSAASARTALLAVLSLLAVAAAWGSSFPLTKTLLQRMTPLNLLAVRFTIAGVVMLVVFYPAVRRLSRRTLVRGVVLGATYGVAQILQTVGLVHTSASVAGFVTGMYVVLTPICAALLLHTTIGRRVWAGAIMATIGLAILALSGLHLGLGEAVTLIAAVVYALHIIGLGAWSSAREALGLAAVQIVVTGLVALLAATITDPGGLTLPGDTFDWVAVLYLALISGAVAMIVQSWAQAYLAPSRAAIIMSTEPAWAALFSITFLAEPLTWRIAVGGALILAATVLVESGPRLPGAAPDPHAPPKLAT
jgi:drug/metabolite transporter (DMT)-like permease